MQGDRARIGARRRRAAFPWPLRYRRRIEGGAGRSRSLLSFDLYNGSPAVRAEDPLFAIDTNLKPTVRLLELSRSVGVKKVIVIMEHTARDGEKKLLERCALPLTGTGVVDMVVTDLGVFMIDEKGMTLAEIAPGVTLQEIRDKTAARFKPGPGIA